MTAARGQGAAFDRSRVAVMVPAAHALGGLGAIRSLGAAGYVVHAVSDTDRAIGLASAYARHRAVHPPGTDPGFAPWFEDYVAAHNIALVIPGGDVRLCANPVFDRYAALFPTVTTPSVLARSNKYELFRALSDGDDTVRRNLPPLLMVDLDRDDLPTEAALNALGTPLFIKLDGRHAYGAAEDQVVRVAAAAEAHTRLAALRQTYAKAVVQGYVAGRGTGVFLLRWEGRTLARFMHLRLHEVPHTGGVSSLRRSWWHQAMADDAEAKLAAIGWQGVGMVEYRWDPETDRFWLMEMNLRFWGSLHLALYAGVDFPRLLADAFFGHPVAHAVTGRPGVVCRNTIPFELMYLSSLWGDRSVGPGRKLLALAEAVALTLDPRVRNDLYFPGDRRLYFRQWRRYIAKKLGRGR